MLRYVGTIRAYVGLGGTEVTLLKESSPAVDAGLIFPLFSLFNGFLTTELVLGITWYLQDEVYDFGSNSLRFNFEMARFIITAQVGMAMRAGMSAIQKDVYVYEDMDMYYNFGVSYLFGTAGGGL